MKKMSMFIFICFLILGISQLSAQESLKEGDVCFKDKCFIVEIAQTDEELMRGLQGRNELEQDRGMLFVFEELGQYRFWMKETLIALDMIWLDETGKVVFIKEDAKPCEESPCDTFISDKDALYVLEVNAGKVKELKIKFGQKAEIKIK